ncbi:efflux RND transporter periplasmic adaptor subunit [Hymenobacter sp.]|uniref:efflux RND transporter periplasmic adaptor subunit n=1 Tax=Hymenobacter sp. TaxID=1898978 RepID=UPI00286D2B60|nr:efflux RND transporter periplasmic adaptor subunit [Hymenobacter sp.]
MPTFLLAKIQRLGLGAVLLTGCGGPATGPAAGPPAPPPAAVVVQRVARAPVVAYDAYEGTVVALEEVELRAEVSGYVTGIFVRDGQRVRRGQRLYEVDATRYQAGLSQAQSQLQVAQTNHAKAAQDAERYNRLAERNAVARQRVDYARADLANAASQVAAARAVLTTARTDVQRAVLTAPFAGTVGFSQVRRGALVTQGATLLNTLSADDPVAVEVALNAALLPRLSELLRTPPPARDSVFTLVLPDGEAYPRPGRLAVLDRTADAQTGTVRARVAFANPRQQLRPGLTGTLRVRNADTGPQLTVPFRAVTEQMGEYYVYVLGDSNRVARRAVRLGTRVGEAVVVRQGLRGEETIVRDGVQNLRDGVVVRPTAPDAAAAGRAAPRR